MLPRVFTSRIRAASPSAFLVPELCCISRYRCGDYRILPDIKATDWEFTNRGLIFGAVLGSGFMFYVFDHSNGTAWLANWLATRLRTNAQIVVRILFLLAALLLLLAALIQTWASAYLHAGVVYAAEVKSESLVADGPYRWVRNPLYFANVLLAISMGSLLSRTGLVWAVGAMLLFCYRLILREEADLQASQGEQYRRYCQAVPRLWPSLRPRIAAAGRVPR